MQLDAFLLAFIAYLFAVASPGPSTLAIISTAMTQGRIPAVVLALGVMTGSMVWAGLAATGLSALLTTYAQALVAIKIAGGVYLLFLAYKSARSALSASAPSQLPSARMTAGALYRRGVLLHLSNPKSVLGWVAILSLGLGPAAPAHSAQILIAGCAVLGVAVHVGYALLFSMPQVTRAYRAARRWIDGALALLFGLAGLRLLGARA
ncbi:LysE family translocator [Pararhodobacter zhoushanensis]|uniref:LysE family translocator n=1 Tax=Pararhodobacter zhoushanensis TaxID=2479545 RepID=UPI000F8EEE66|nr:LysE family translocator [Pararhodobacter zhoushanensis]